MSDSTGQRSGFVARVVRDPAQPPNALLLTGFLGDSSEAGHTRLYFDAELASYVEIPDEAILHVEPMAREQSPLEGFLVWIQRDARLIQGKVGSPRVSASFLEGPIAAQAQRRAAGPGMPGPDDPGFPGGFLQPTLGAPCIPETIPPRCPLPTIPPGCEAPSEMLRCPTSPAICQHITQGSPICQPSVLVQCPSQPVQTCPTAPSVCCPSIQFPCPTQQPWQCPSQLTFCQSQVDACPSQLTFCQSQQIICQSRAVCPSQLVACQSQQVICQSQLTFCQSQVDACPSQLTFCQSQQIICQSRAVCPSQLVACQSQQVICQSQQIICQSRAICPSQGVVCESVNVICNSAVCPTFGGCPSAVDACPSALCPPGGGFGGGQIGGR